MFLPSSLIAQLTVTRQQEAVLLEMAWGGIVTSGFAPHLQVCSVGAGKTSFVIGPCQMTPQTN